MRSGAAPESLLSVDRLGVDLVDTRDPRPVLDDISLSVAPGETLCLVGESGCGKTLTALAIAGLLPSAAKVRTGECRYRGESLLGLPESARRRFRGGEIAMIFQEPMSSLNPVQKVGTQVAEVVKLHIGLGGRAAMKRARELLGEVGIPDPAGRMGAYPHELSGGLRQRVMIAMALAGEPGLLIADEPTTALDVTIQAQVLELLMGLKERRGLALLLISHDLGVVAEIGQRVCVLYAGQIVESGTVAELFAEPRHPYTQALLASLLRIDGVQRPLVALPGTVPAPGKMPAGCRFRERCSVARPECTREQDLVELGDGRALRCAVGAAR